MIPWDKLHGAITHFPIALLLFSTACDLVSVILKKLPFARELRSISLYALPVAALASLGAVISGIVLTKGDLWGLAVVRAYLDIESLRLGDRLKVEQTIDPDLLKALMPPFSFQPLVENAVQHGLHSSPRAGRLQLIVRPKGEWLEMSVSDDGQGVASTEIEHLFFAERPRVHALVLLRRRLQGLFGRSFRLEVHSEIGEGTTVTMRIPLPKTFRVGAEPPRAISS